MVGRCCMVGRNIYISCVEKHDSGELTGDITVLERRKQRWFRYVSCTSPYSCFKRWKYHIRPGIYVSDWETDTITCISPFISILTPTSLLLPRWTWMVEVMPSSFVTLVTITASGLNINIYWYPETAYKISRQRWTQTERWNCRGWLSWKLGTVSLSYLKFLNHIFWTTWEFFMTILFDVIDFFFKHCSQ